MTRQQQRSGKVCGKIVARMIQRLFPSILPGITVGAMKCRAVRHPSDEELHVFVLDARLTQDTLEVGDFPLSRLLLSNDSNYPWFVLVPRRADVTEIFELPEADQVQLWKETTVLSSLLKGSFKADKLNVGALGNVVSQLHMHVIVRYRNDIAWPAPVWGKHPTKPYTPEQVAAIRQQLKAVMPGDFTFSQESA
jgi:diadenosine tetraphosphate (Ap4A) HIT family hydrolase